MRWAWLPVAVTTCSAVMVAVSSEGTRLPPRSAILVTATRHSEPVHSNPSTCQRRSMVAPCWRAPLAMAIVTSAGLM